MWETDAHMGSDWEVQIDKRKPPFDLSNVCVCQTRALCPAHDVRSPGNAPPVIERRVKNRAKDQV